MTRFIAIVALSACAAPASAPSMHAAPAPLAAAATCPATSAPHGATPAAACAAAATDGGEVGRRLALPLDRDRMFLEPGRWVVMVSAPALHHVSIGVAGPVDALQRFDVVAPRSLPRLRTGAADDDWRLPAFVSFESQEEAVEIPVVVDVSKRVQLMRVVAASATAEEARPLVGMPFPLERRAGYFLEAPTRYLFVRRDVAGALRAALLQTRIRFDRGAIGIGDASQWDGGRPASDLGKPRHISHDGGVDVDIGLPTEDGASGHERRCTGVLVLNDRLECAPGTVREFDAVRLAYLLGLLIDGPTPGGRYISDPKRRPGPIAEVETIFTDQVYIDEIRKALPKLRAKRWIHDEAFGALGEEGILRHSPWHTDHVHVRFTGKHARVPDALRFKPAELLSPPVGPGAIESRARK